VGPVTLSTPFEHHYLKGRVATFTTDEPGTYTLRLRAELAFDDPQGKSVGISELTIVAEGPSTNPGRVGGAARPRGAAPAVGPPALPWYLEGRGRSATWPRPAEPYSQITSRV
jgi:hypothetical protein